MSTVDQASTARTRRSLVAGTVGNFVEWYEFGAYGFFATVIAANFFSSTSTSDAESLIKTYASFALAFFFRPIGAAVFGRVGDRIGRRPTLILVLLLMTAVDHPDRSAADVRDHRCGGALAADAGAGAAGVVGGW